jgi:hypothetical protein
MDGMNAKKNVFIIGATSESKFAHDADIQTDPIKSILLCYDPVVSIRFVLL